MSSSVDRFYSSIKNAAAATSSELIDLFVYHLTEEAAEDAANVRTIEQAFRDCGLHVPSRTASHLSEGANSKSKKFVKVNGGYRLQRHYRDKLKARLGAESVAKEISTELRNLETRFPEGPKKIFLSETIDCFEVSAYRAAIVMCWILTLNHLFDYVLSGPIDAFNAQLAKVTDKRVKVSSVHTRDDFGDIPENKLIELLRAAGIISNDVRKILEEKLGTRNSSAHPSGITIKRSKAIEFIDDLIENVVLKYGT